jgi:tetratricopeptide (TPR) repeat protein
MLTDLSITPIAETIRILSAAQKSGDLQVRSAKVVKTLFFDHGRLVFAASNLKKDRLGEALVALGRITDEQFREISALMRADRKRRFGEALVQSGLMDKKELGGSVARQVRRIALSLFEFTEGAASFEERRCAIPLDYMVSLSIHRLLHDGIRAMPSRELVMAGLGNLDRPVVLAPIPPFPFEKKRSAEEKEILDAAQKKVTVRRLAWAAGGLAFSRLRSVYALLAAGILQEADGKQAKAQPAVQMETGTFLLSALQRQPDPSGQEAIRREIQDELERSAHLDREAWLKVAATAPREHLLKALEEKMERYHALREAIGDDEHLKTDIEVILGRASAMLRLARQQSPSATTPLSKSVVAAKIGGIVLKAQPAPIAVQAPEAPPRPARPQPVIPKPPASRAVTASSAATPPPDDVVIEPEEEMPDIEVEEEEAVPEIEAAEELVEEPDGEAAEEAEEEEIDTSGMEEEVAEEPEAVRALSYGAEGDEGSPPEAMAYEAAPAEAAPTQAAMESAVGPGSSNFAGRAKLEHLLMEGEVRMTVSDYANAVKVYQKLVEAAPKVPAFRMRLAIAMTCYPRTAKQAEREFLEAVRLDPNNADTHYQFGLYFKAMKVRSRAIAEMRTAVRLNPRHEEARSELESLSPKDSVLGSLRKMFR